MKHTSNVISQLSELGIIDQSALAEYSPRVRDRDDVRVLRCAKSGVVALARTNHLGQAYYYEKSREIGMTDMENGAVSIAELEDSQRRAMDFGSMVEAKHWLDIGTGTGQILDLLQDRAASASGVEPQEQYRQAACARGLNVLPTITDVDDASVELVTLFHVFEHIADPMGMLGEIRSKMADGGQLMLEVPHARDFLLETLDCGAFRDFTLWSEHLVLHTKGSLTRMLSAAGFSSIRVEGYQRYPLSNHLYWLRHANPGGHDKWAFLNSEALQKSYSQALQEIGQTDTLIAYAQRG